MEKRAEELLNRAVVALESLANEPELEIPTSPPICPYCGTKYVYKGAAPKGH